MMREPPVLLCPIVVVNLNFAAHHKVTCTDFFGLSVMRRQVVEHRRELRYQVFF